MLLTSGNSDNIDLAAFRAAQGFCGRIFDLAGRDPRDYDGAGVGIGGALLAFGASGHVR
jgi:hypothetical protein